MPTIEEIDAAIARKQRQATVPSLADIDAAIARKRQAQAPEEPLYQRAWNAVTGNAAEQLPDLYGDQFAQQAKGLRTAAGRSDFTGSAKLSASAMFGDDNDVANAVRREFPDSQLEQDANGNPIIRMGDGSRYYVNQPGLDMNDAGRFGGKILQYVPAAKAAGLGGSLLARMGIGAAASGATDVATQVAAGRESIDPVQTATTAALGGGSEALAPLLQRGGRALANVFRSDPKKLEMGQELARAAGFGAVPDDIAMAMYGARDQIKAGASPAALLAENQFGFKLTKGQKTGNAAQMDYEAFLRAKDPQGPLAMLKDYNEQQMGRVNQSMRETLARGTPAELEQDSARAIREGLIAAEKQGQRQVRAAYDVANTQGRGVYAAADDFSAIPTKIDQAFRGKVALSPELTPATLGARKILGEFVEDSGNAAVSIKRIDELRKRMNVLRGSATKPTDVRAMSELYRTFDDEVGSAIVRNMMDGGPEALEALKTARDLSARMFRMFDGTKPSGRAILKSMADEATPEQVANFFVGANGLNAAGASAVAKRYLSIVGKESKSANALRDLVARRLFNGKGDAKQSADVTANLLNQALNGKGNTLLGTLYNKTELELLRNYQRVLTDALLPPKQTLRDFVGPSSGTTERLTRWLANSRLGKLPFGGQMMNDLILRGQSNAAMGAPASLRPALLPAAMTATGAQARDERKR